MKPRTARPSPSLHPRRIHGPTPALTHPSLTCLSFGQQLIWAKLWEIHATPTDARMVRDLPRPVWAYVDAAPQGENENQIM